MTDPKSQADAIDPRNGHLESGKKSLHVQVPIADLIAASDTTRALLSRIEELESAAALAGKMAIEEAAKRIKEIRDGYGPPLCFDISYGVADECVTAIRSLSKPIDRNALIERGAEAIVREYSSLDFSSPEPIAKIYARAVLSAWIGEETK